MDLDMQARTDALPLKVQWTTRGHTHEYFMTVEEFRADGRWQSLHLDLAVWWNLMVLTLELDGRTLKVMKLPS